MEIMGSFLERWTDRRKSQTGLDFFSSAVLPFLHFLSGHEKSCWCKAPSSSPALTQADKDHNPAAGQRTHFEVAEGGAWFVHLFPEYRCDDERRRVSTDLPSICPTGIKPRSGHALSHPPHQCHEWATSPSPSPSSSSWRNVFAQNCLKSWSWKGSLGCQPVSFLRRLKALDQSDRHLLPPSGSRKVLSKNRFLLWCSVPSGSHIKLQAAFNILTPSLFCAPAALSGHQSQSFTQLFIILISILPFPLPSQPLSPP